MAYKIRFQTFIAAFLSLLFLLCLEDSGAVAVSDSDSEIPEILPGRHAMSSDTLKKGQVITLEQLKDSLQQYQKHNNKLGMARSFHRLAELHNKMNHPSEAVAHYLVASDYYKQLDKTNRVIEIYHRVATLYRKYNHFDEALHYARRARELASEIKNDSLVAMSAFHLGRIYEAIGRHRQAEKSYRVALDLFQKYTDTAELSDMYHHLAEMQEAQGKLNRSLDLHQKALEIRDEIDDSAGLAKSYFEMGKIFAAKDDLDMAIDYHQRAADIRDKLGDNIGVAKNYIRIGKLHVKNGRPETALNYANRAMHIANSFDALELKVEALGLALDSHLRLGNLDRASGLRDSLKDLQDSLKELEQEQQQRNLEFHLKTREKVDSLRQFQKRQEAQQARFEREHFLLMIAIIAALALVIILVLLYNRYRYRKQQENILRNKNQELEKLNERLEELNEEKNEILQTVTHDMKNPLAGIIGLADLALSEEDMSREELLGFMAQIEETAQNMDDMVRKLLDIRAIESGGHDLDMRPDNISKILDEVVKNNLHRAREKDIEIITKWDDDRKEMVLGDHTAIQRVLDNLLSNAIKYTPKGKNVYLDLNRNNGNVQVEVQDEGPGIKPEERSKLFTKFGRLSSEPTGGEHTTGLGLYIARQLADQMDGKIGCESEPGKGATFFLELNSVDPESDE